MSRSRKELVLEAVSLALKIRKQVNCELRSPINVFDLCERLGVQVFFQDIPSMEGIYMPDAKPFPTIVVSSLRPSGRKAMTCGHELGHHVFKHGNKWDELIENRSQSRQFEPEEFQADVFSANLLMPKSSVSHALATRNINPAKCRAEDIYALSHFFGVSYGAFVFHLERMLNFISMQRASELTDIKPKDLREALLGKPCPQNLFVVDKHWKERAVDAEIGDTLLLPPCLILEGSSAKILAASGSRTVISTIAPGIARVSHSSGWCTFIRVMRRNFVGRAPFRFDEEVDDDT